MPCLHLWGPDDKSIAILPFDNLSGDPSQEYFSDGIAEEILNALAHIQDLKVPSRTSSFQFKGKKVDLREVGEKLHVSTVLEGSVRRQGDRLRINAELISVKDGYRLWSQQFDRKMDDVFAIQEEIARSIVQKLTISLKQNENIEIGQAPTESKEAYDAYLKGYYFWNIRQLRESEKYFTQAIKLDTTFASAYAALAETYKLFPVFLIEMLIKQCQKHRTHLRKR
jgi:adenylate cyclase